LGQIAFPRSVVLLLAHLRAVNCGRAVFWANLPFRLFGHAH